MGIFLARRSKTTRIEPRHLKGLRICWSSCENQGEACGARARMLQLLLCKVFFSSRSPTHTVVEHFELLTFCFTQERSSKRVTIQKDETGNFYVCLSSLVPPLKNSIQAPNVWENKIGKIKSKLFSVLISWQMTIDSFTQCLVWVRTLSVSLSLFSLTHLFLWLKTRTKRAAVLHVFKVKQNAPQQRCFVSCAEALSNYHSAACGGICLIRRVDRQQVDPSFLRFGLLASCSSGFLLFACYFFYPI